MSSPFSKLTEEGKKKLVKLIGVLVAVIILLVVVYFIIIPRLAIEIRTVDIAEYLRDGESKTWSIKGYGSKLEVKLTSHYDDMRVTIVVDGRTIYDKRTWSVDFVMDLGYGYHVVHVAIENPTVFGLGKTILVTGYVRYS